MMRDAAFEDKGRLAEPAAFRQDRLPEPLRFTSEARSPDCTFGAAGLVVSGRRQPTTV